ncbi:DUF58 domain-containing protein [Kineosporia succinea]|uniref:Uncharacterized protein (DUF58 family) n=1 Tax=Kineosporia succinea TaxID=84632 RepID=A0ABT9PD62_9ACTN|nr:DUF58 domain-containing protein [Kineosporia succinea]MDP9830651.1 uncharacterized protein (DUF58 family) [Kineosporia succinea]
MTTTGPSAGPGAAATGALDAPRGLGAPESVDLGRIRLSPAGRGLLVAAIVCLVGGFTLGYDELFGLAGAAGLLVLVAVAQVVVRVSARVERSIAPQRVSVGETAMGMLQIHMRGRGRSMRAVDTVGGRRHEIPVPSGGGDVRRVVYELDTSRRGVFPVGPLRLHQHDLADLAHRRREAGEILQLVVRPVVHPLRQPAQGRSRDIEGPRTTSGAESGVTFSGLREYVLGDDLRIIHWKGLARGGPLTVRTHVDSTRSDILILLDDRPASYTSENDFEQAVSFAASVAAMAFEAAVTVRVTTVGGTSLAGSAATVLDGLAGVTPASSTSGGLGAAAQQSALRGGRSAVAVLGRNAVGEMPGLSALRQGWGTVVAAVIDPDATPNSRPADAGITVLAEATAADLALSWNRRWA